MEKSDRKKDIKREKKR